MDSQKYNIENLIQIWCSYWSRKINEIALNTNTIYKQEITKLNPNLNYTVSFEKSASARVQYHH